MNYNLNEESSIEDVKNVLIAIGVNGCASSYDPNLRYLRDSFCRLPLSEIAPLWSNLIDSIKIMILNEHIEEFKTWIESR